MPPPEPNYDKAGSTAAAEVSSSKRDIFGLDAEDQRTPIILNRTKRPKGYTEGRRRRKVSTGELNEEPGSFDPDNGGYDVEWGVIGRQAAQLSALFAGDRDQYIAYQRALYNAGYYGSSKPALGRYTDQDQKAWNDLLFAVARVNATGQGISVEDVLTGQSLDGDDDGWPEEEEGATVIKQTDPASIRVALVDAFQKALGRRPTDEELEPFVLRYQTLERNYSELVNSIDAGTTTGRVDVTAPDLGSQAEEYVQQSNLNEIKDFGQLQYLDKFASMITGG